MSDQLILKHLSVGPLQVNCFLVACPESLDAAVIDPGDEGERILEMATEAGFRVRKVINTHGHFDHIGANRHLVHETGAELMIHADDLLLLDNAQAHAEVFGLNVTMSPKPDRLLEDGDVISVGQVEFTVLHVPGHSPGGICLLSGSHLFVGDVLFAGSIGRTDLPGGDHDALVEGIRERLMTLPEETLVHTGHGPDTTIGREKLNNPFVGSRAWR